ncbi:hypothetical protein L829_2111 [Mycobacteroides abscessus MAB_030201_1075]|uniref:Uncharacterized protein n=1 Tax=Mycobacteroides abscessus MAB_030201_1075 TaxID=1335410 RepID=A0A829PN40_9MYCO|nr:hypothetical protein L829_2111 [Mycobacteroides abscessus MAB_030201_1075]
MNIKKVNIKRLIVTGVSAAAMGLATFAGAQGVANADPITPRHRLPSLRHRRFLTGMGCRQYRRRHRYLRFPRSRSRDLCPSQGM